jgi:DNA-binding NtrC family response regulator
MTQANARLKQRLLQLTGLDLVLLLHTPEISALREDILDVAETDVPVMILGDTGTGKELVARALHDLGRNPAGPFLALNCAALSADTFEAEMFGVEGGATGRLVAADGGTVFLDEIAACPPLVQAKLLRVIEDKEILPIGAATPVSVDMRIVSATNEDADAAIAAGDLRQDLVFRLNTVVLTIPPLRRRRDDLTLLMTHFLREYGEAYQMEPPVMDQDDLAALLAHDWPGNVRELRNAGERRVLAARRGAGSMAQAIRNDQQLGDVPDTLRSAVAAFERELISKAITAHAGRMDAAAEALGIGRRTLNEKIVKLGLDKDALL